MKKAEILPNMTAIWLRNQTTEFLLGTDRRKFTLSILVEAEIPRGGRGSENFSQKPKFSGHFLLTSSLNDKITVTWLPSIHVPTKSTVAQNLPIVHLGGERVECCCTRNRNLSHKVGNCIFQRPKLTLARANPAKFIPSNYFIVLSN